MNMERSTEQGHLNGLTTLNILVNSTIITSMGKEFIHGVMAGDMKVNGKTIRCMAKVHSHGLMEENMSENT